MKLLNDSIPSLPSVKSFSLKGFHDPLKVTLPFCSSLFSPGFSKNNLHSNQLHVYYVFSYPQLYTPKGVPFYVVSAPALDPSPCLSLTSPVTAYGGVISSQHQLRRLP